MPDRTVSADEPQDRIQELIAENRELLEYLAQKHNDTYPGRSAENILSKGREKDD